MSKKISMDRAKETATVIVEHKKRAQTEIEDPKQIFIKKILEAKSGTRTPIPIEFINLAKNKRLETINVEDKEFEQLVASIKELGILHAPLITILDGDIVPLGGNRRIAASKFLAHENVVCEIKHFPESHKNTLAAIVENTARKNWNVVAIAKTLKELNELGYEITRLATLMGWHRQTIGRLLKVAGWNSEILDLIQKYPEKIKMMAILNIANKTLSQKEVLNRVQELAGLIKVDHKAQKFAQNQTKANNFIRERKLTEPQKKLVFEVLAEFGFLIKSS